MHALVLHFTSIISENNGRKITVPIIKSAKKRVRVARKSTVRNVKTKRSLKAALKAFGSALTSGKKVGEAHAKAQSTLDKAGKKNVMHKNKIARKKRQLAKQAKASKVSLAGSAKKTAKPAAKKTAAKKPAAKKPAAKKSSKK
jgi:small subunit ribosomal protein S20